MARSRNKAGGIGRFLTAVIFYLPLPARFICRINGFKIVKVHYLFVDVINRLAKKIRRISTENANFR